MSFRKDELIIPDESDEDDDNDLALFSCGEIGCEKKEKEIKSIEDAYDLTEEIDKKMDKVQ